MQSLLSSEIRRSVARGLSIEPPVVLGKQFITARLGWKSERVFSLSCSEGNPHQRGP